MAGAERVDVAVVGAGVVGLAIANEVAQTTGREVMILEQHKSFGTETSSRNSEVIHAGIYYKPGSVKAQMCVEGKLLLYEYCRSRSIPHKRTAKLIVATEREEVGKLEAIKANAALNGVLDIRLLGKEDVARMEPEIQCEAALLSPSTGIVDSHNLMLSLLGEAESHGCRTAYGSQVVGGSVEDGASPYVKLVVQAENGERVLLECNAVINAGGLHATKLASSISGRSGAAVPEMKFSKGNYFSLSGVKPPSSTLVYPVPVPGGLGVHLTLDLAGRARFGPDNEPVKNIEYSVDIKRSESFYEKIRKFWPALPDRSLQPDYSGIRPQLSAVNGTRDFLIRSEGISGQLINLFGIESPGLTSALAIGKRVARLLPRR